jgi:3D (Asp-Asp-Asp) domain-containing protein
MRSRHRISLRLMVGASLCAVVASASAASPSASVAGLLPSGGAGLTGLLAPNHLSAAQIPPPPSPHSPGTWLTKSTISEYWPVPEAWFRGQPVTAPGLPGKHRIDWLYSAMGVSMQGEGLGLDGRMYHLSALGDGGWVTMAGRPTSTANGWAAGPPYWRAGAFWRNPFGAVTFPLASGGWSAGIGRRYVSLPGVSFAAGPSLALTFYQSIAVDPRVIPLGSPVYIPAYRNDGHGGWFIAQDTGGGIIGRHVDVYRSPPTAAGAAGQYLTNQRIFFVRPRG